MWPWAEDVKHTCLSTSVGLLFSGALKTFCVVEDLNYTFQNLSCYDYENNFANMIQV